MEEGTDLFTGVAAGRLPIAFVVQRAFEYLEEEEPIAIDLLNEDLQPRTGICVLKGDGGAEPLHEVSRFRCRWGYVSCCGGNDTLRLIASVV